MANLPPPVFPIIIAEWERNNRERVRVSLGRYNGRETIDVRAWWRDSDGTWRPGRQGLTLGIRHLSALAEGIAEALNRARALGLVEPIATDPKDRTAADRQRRYRQRQKDAAPVQRNA